MKFWAGDATVHGGLGVMLSVRAVNAIFGAQIVAMEKSNG